MIISYIINSAALDPWVAGSNPHRSAAYRQRADLLRHRVLPAAIKQGFDEIIVAGCFEEGEGYTYLPVAPRYRDRRDALLQREAGARLATGDILVFGHDDHAIGNGFSSRLVEKADDPAWDLIIPRRIHGITGVEMNNGKAENYCGGHVLVLRRWLWAAVPWTKLNTEYWDTSQTREWRAVGGKIVWDDDLVHIDVEAGQNEH